MLLLLLLLSSIFDRRVFAQGERGSGEQNGWGLSFFSFCFSQTKARITSVFKMSSSSSSTPASKKQKKAATPTAATTKPRVKASVASSAKKSAPQRRVIVRRSGVSDNSIITMYNKCAGITSANRASFITEAHAQIEELVDDLLRGALAVMAYRGASTITAEDLVCAGKAMNVRLYGCGNFLSLESERRQRAAASSRKKKDAKASRAAAGVAAADDDEVMSPPVAAAAAL